MSQDSSGVWTGVSVVLEYVAPSFVSGKDEAIEEVVEMVHTDFARAGGVARGWVVTGTVPEFDKEIGQWRVTVTVDVRQVRFEDTDELCVRKSHQYVYDVMVRELSSVDSIVDVGGGRLVEMDS